MSETSSSSLPRIEIFDHVDGVLGQDLAKLEELSRVAMAPCLAQGADFSEPPATTSEESSRAPLATLSEVEVSVVSDAAIAAVHGDFMGDPSATDVITFHHGEILVSYDTACQRANEMSHPLLRELLLYVIHGLLHLNGYDDREAAQRRRMHQVQDRILDEVWPLPDGPKT